jgi:hypothetical protein
MYKLSTKSIRLEEINEKFRTFKICLASVKNNGYSLQYVLNQNVNICLEAVRKTGKSLKYVKEQTANK